MDFKLPQIVATIEKLDSAVDQLFDSKNVSSYLISLNALLDFVDDDPPLKYIFSLFKGRVSIPNVHQWFEENIQLHSSMVGSGRYDLPREVPKRVLFLYRFLSKVVNEGEKVVNEASISWYGSLSRLECWDYFMRDFVGMFYRDLRAMLADLRVEAELSDSKDVKEPQIVNVIMGGTNQVNQANNLNDSSNINQN